MNSPKIFKIRKSFSLAGLLFAFLLYPSLTFASFTLTTGLEQDLCTGPKYSGETEIVGNFHHPQFLFGYHQQNEFRLTPGEEKKLPLADAYPTLNRLLKLNLTDEQVSQLPTDRVSKIKINNYQAYCEGLPSVDFMEIDQSFKNAENDWILVKGSSEAGFMGDIEYEGEKTIQGLLRTSENPEENDGVDYLLEVEPKDQLVLPLQDWAKIIQKYNTVVKIQNKNEKLFWLTKNNNKKVVVTIDQYKGNSEGLPGVRIKANFVDVDSNNEFANDIQFLKTHNIVDGYRDGTFHPSRTLNRAEFSKIALLSKVSVEDIYQNQNCFPDVAEQWFASYVCTLKDGSAIQGYADEKFHPEQAITIAEGLKILLKIFAIPYEETPQWTDGIITAAQQKNLLKFSFETPNQNLSRGQMASIIAQLLQQNL